MPKVIINKREYKKNTIGGYVAMWMKRAGKVEKDLAAELGVSQPGASFKIRNNTFSYADLITIFDYLEVPDEEILQVMKI